MQCWEDSFFCTAVWPFVHWEALMYLLWNKKTPPARARPSLRTTRSTITLLWRSANWLFDLQLTNLHQFHFLYNVTLERLVKKWRNEVWISLNVYELLINATRGDFPPPMKLSFLDDQMPLNNSVKDA